MCAAISAKLFLELTLKQIQMAPFFFLSFAIWKLAFKKHRLERLCCYLMWIHVGFLFSHGVKRSSGYQSIFQVEEKWHTASCYWLIFKFFGIISMTMLSLDFQNNLQLRDAVWSVIPFSSFYLFVLFGYFLSIFIQDIIIYYGLLFSKCLE